MNTREKFRYMAFGGALVFLGMVGAMMSPLTAEKDKFGAIECTRLTVVDENGGAMVRLTTDEDGGFVYALGKDGLSGAWLGTTEHGGHVQVNGKGEGKAVMSINEYGNGAVSTLDKNGNRQR